MGDGGDALDPASTEFLLDRHRAGDGHALERLFLRHFQSVERIVRVRTGPFLRSRHELQDIVQEVFVEVCDSVGDFRPRGDAQFVDWLAKVAENKIRNLKKKEIAAKRKPSEALLSLQALRVRVEGSTVWDVVDDETRPPEKISRKEMCDIVDECLAQEEVEAQREVILKRNYAHGDWSWIAGELGCPTPHAAEQLHQRAFGKLRERVRRRLGDGGASGM